MTLKDTTNVDVVRSNRVRAAAAALVGAPAFAVFLIAGAGSTIAFTTDADLTGLTSGFYPIERTPARTYVWTRPHAQLSIPGIDRRIDWRWTARALIWRPVGVPQPHVRIAIDGVVVVERTIVKDGEELAVTIPRRPGRRGLVMTFDTVPDFVARPRDSRQLGIAFESMSLEPAGMPLPPLRAFLGGAAAVLALGTALLLAGLSSAWVFGCVMAAAVSQAWLMTRGVAAYGDYPIHVAAILFWVGLAMLLVVRTVERIRREPFGAAARAVIAFSTLASCLKLLVLLHPHMPIGDAVFHAHRLEFVLSGRLYFTSVAPGEYAFPYPIFLYVFAAPFSPWAPATLDRVALLRIVVTAADAVAGALLYWMVVRTTADRLAAAGTVVWYHLMPMTAWIMTWGNLTNAFGQALFVASVVVIVGAPIAPTRRRPTALLAVLAAAAFLAHPSTCAILITLLALTTVLYRWRGGAELRGAAHGVRVATLAAAAAAFVLYYAWFPAVYRTELSRAASASALRATEPGAPLTARIAAIPQLAVSYFGWPTLVAAAVGTWRLCKGAGPPRLTLLLAAWVLTSLLFLAIGVLTPIEMRYHFAVFPALALAAAFGCAWSWRDRMPLRIGAAAVLGAAVWIGLRQWMTMLA